MAKPKTAHELKLLEAVQRGSISNIKKMLSSHPIKLDDERYFDYHLIIEALNKNNVVTAKLLMEKGFRVYKKSKTTQETTVLHAAFGIHSVQTRITDFITTLLAKGASLDILSLNEQNKTPFHMAIDKKNQSVIDLFLSQLDNKILDEKYLLHYAIEKDKSETVSKLIAKGLSLIKKDGNNKTPFCSALKYNNFKILNILLSRYRIKRIDPKNQDDVAPVYIASMHGNLKVIKKYTKYGLPVNIPLKTNAKTCSCLRSYPGFTLLHFAVKYFQLEVVKLLLETEADILVQDKVKSSALHIAFETKEAGIWKTWQDFDNNNLVIDLLLKANTKLKSNPFNKNGLSHFHIACSRDEPAIVQHFLKLGAPINQAVKSNCYLYKKFSPLHFAAKFRCTKTMGLLLKNGADVEQRDFKKMTALHVAARESCLETVNLLLQYGADITAVDSFGKTPVHWAFESKNYRILDLLYSVPNMANSNPINSEGLSHFHIACTRNNVDVVESFIKKGVQVNTRVPTKPDEKTEWSGYSALHFAVSHNKPKVVQQLLRVGANIGIKDNGGFTPYSL